MADKIGSAKGGAGAMPSHGDRPDVGQTPPPPPKRSGIPALGESRRDAQPPEPSSGAGANRELSRKEAVDKAVETSDRGFTKGLDDKRQREAAYE